MERRIDKRWHRRLSVRFWVKGDPKASPGYSTNISNSGIFIRTAKPLPSGSRLRVEIFEAQTGFVVEGIVARAIRVPSHLQSVRQPGMGVRFLPVHELLRDIIPTQAEEHTATGVEPPPRPSGGAATAAANAPPIPPRILAYRVTFKTRNQYMGVFQRDMINGGLFVATSQPARIDDQIEIELSVRDSGIDAIRIPAKVVHRVEPGMEGLDGTNLMAGMGVEFLDAKEAIRRLTTLATALF